MLQKGYYDGPQWLRRWSKCYAILFFCRIKSSKKIQSHPWFDPHPRKTNINIQKKNYYVYFKENKKYLWKIAWYKLFCEITNIIKWDFLIYFGDLFAYLLSLRWSKQLAKVWWRIACLKKTQLNQVSPVWWEKHIITYFMHVQSINICIFCILFGKSTQTMI